MDNKTRVCCVCHSEYKFCPRCSAADKNKPTWYFSFCSENCKNIYNVTSRFENGILSGEDAAKELTGINLSNIDKFGDSYKKSIDKIKTFTKKVEVPAVDDKADVTEVVDETIVENPTRKKNEYKKMKS